MTGYDSKRKMAADKLHWSDCAVHNGPAYPAGLCNCGAAQEPINLLEARKIAAEYGTPDSQIDSGNLYFALSKCLKHIDAQPMQEPVADRLERLLWKYIDLQAAHPEHKPNPKTWPHLMTYAPLPVQRKWVGLTDEEIEDLYFDKFSMGELKAFAKAIEAKLKEKNNGT
jgi:hypothetical protein